MANLLNCYSEYFAKNDLEGFGDFKEGGKIIRRVKFIDVFVLLAKEKTVLQWMIDRLTEIVRWYRMEINVEKPKAAFPSTDYDKSYPTGECGIIQVFW